METVIVLCLVIVILLLVDEKREVKKEIVKEKPQNNKVVQLPDIMGKPKLGRSHREPNTTNENRPTMDLGVSNNFNAEIPQEELDEDFNSEPDYLSEELLYREKEPVEGAGYASGVTFEELAAVEMLLGQENPEPFLQKQAVAIVHKLQGTELFSLLENSIEGASRKIAELLDKGLASEMDSSSSTMRNTNAKEFNIEDFV